MSHPRQHMIEGGGCVSSPIRYQRCGILFFFWQDAGQNEKALRPERRAFPASTVRTARSPDSAPASVPVACTGASASARLSRRRCCAYAPEDGDLRGLGLLDFPFSRSYFDLTSCPVHEDMIALVERVGDGLAEAVEGHDAVPLGFGLPLVVRVLPRLLCSDGPAR